MADETQPTPVSLEQLEAAVRKQLGLDSRVPIAGVAKTGENGQLEPATADDIPRGKGLFILLKFIEAAHKQLLHREFDTILVVVRDAQTKEIGVTLSIHPADLSDGEQTALAQQLLVDGLARIASEDRRCARCGGKH